MKLSKPQRRHVVVVPVHGHCMAQKFVAYCRRTGHAGTLRNLPGEWVVFKVDVAPAKQEAFMEGWETHYMV